LVVTIKSVCGAPHATLIVAEWLRTMVVPITVMV